MSKKILPLTLTYSTDEELYFKLIKIHSVSANWNLSDTHIKILTYFIRFGYNKSTIKMICDEVGLTRGSLGVHLSNLRKGKVGRKEIKKLIELHKTNTNISVISTELKDIQKLVTDNDIMMFVNIENEG